MWDQIRLLIIIEMLYIKKQKPSLKTKADSVRVKLFV